MTWMCIVRGLLDNVAREQLVVVLSLRTEIQDAVVAFVLRLEKASHLVLLNTPTRRGRSMSTQCTDTGVSSQGKVSGMTEQGKVSGMTAHS